jgi:hypothetical protein
LSQRPCSRALFEQRRRFRAWRDAHAQRVAERLAIVPSLLLIGPPGSGKTMLARRLPSILPALALEEAIEVTAIHSFDYRGNSAERGGRRPPHKHRGGTVAAWSRSSRPCWRVGISTVSSRLAARHRASASAGAASTGTSSSGGTRPPPATRSPAGIGGSSRARAANPPSALGRGGPHPQTARGHRPSQLALVVHDRLA